MRKCVPYHAYVGPAKRRRGGLARLVIGAAAIALAVCLAPSRLRGQEVWTARSEELRKEDVRSALGWLKRNDPFAEHFVVCDKRRAGGDYSILVISAYPDRASRKQAPEETFRGAGSVGVFVVRGATNEVYLLLDLQPAHSIPPAMPQIAHASEHDLVLDYIGDYNMYLGSRKYVYDLRRRTLRYKIPFFRLTFRDSTVAGTRIYYLGLGDCVTEGSFECRNYAVGVESFAAGAKPSYELIKIPRIPPHGPPRSIVVGPGKKVTVRDPAAETSAPPVEHPDLPGFRHRVPATHAFRRKGGWVVIWNEESAPRGYGPGRSGIFAISRGGRVRFFPVPVPDVETWRRLRGPEMIPRGWRAEAGSIQNHIGPFRLEGDRLWFAGTFYDGEGMSGVGNIGWFDLAALQYEIRYPAELAPWSASALLVENESVWVGLVRRPEGALAGGGILRYDRRTGAFTHFPFTAVVNSLDRMGDALYAGTSQGIYVLRDGVVTVLSVEPVVPGRWELVVRMP